MNQEKGKVVVGMDEYIKREAAIAAAKHAWAKGLEPSQYIEVIPSADVDKLSDGYHTFADLYEQRLILSAALAKNNPYAWKSKRHEDGSVPFGGGWFIMGFDTDEGCYTYHYELKDWDLFHCKELDKGKPWDGHTSKDVRRLLSIPAADATPVRYGRWIGSGDGYADGELVYDVWECSECGYDADGADEEPNWNYCPNCGARMDGERKDGNRDA